MAQRWHVLGNGLSCVPSCDCLRFKCALKCALHVEVCVRPGRARKGDAMMPCYGPSSEAKEKKGHRHLGHTATQTSVCLPNEYEWSMAECEANKMSAAHSANRSAELHIRSPASIRTLFDFDAACLLFIPAIRFVVVCCDQLSLVVSRCMPCHVCIDCVPQRVSPNVLHSVHGLHPG